MNKKKVKEVVITVGVGVITGTIVGVAYNAGFKKASTLCTKRFEEIFKSYVCGGDYFTATNLNYTLADLGKLGESLVDEKHDINTKIVNVIGFAEKRM